MTGPLATKRDPMRTIILLAAATVIALLAGCASTPQQSTAPSPNATSNVTACGSGVATVTAHQVGNGAGDPTANNTPCVAPVPGSPVLPTFGYP